MDAVEERKPKGVMIYEPSIDNLKSATAILERQGVGQSEPLRIDTDGEGSIYIRPVWEVYHPDREGGDV